MAKVTVGGKDYIVKPLVFATLEKVWPYVERVQELVRQAQADPTSIKSPVVMMKPAVAVVALAIAQDDPELQEIYLNGDGKEDAELDAMVIAKVSRMITAVETSALEPAVNEIMKEAGFVAEDGAPGEQTASPSTATGTDSSQNSSPQGAKEDPGTE